MKTHFTQLPNLRLAAGLISLAAALFSPIFTAKTSAAETGKKPTREEQVRGDLASAGSAESGWIYNDLAEGLKQSAATGKPVLLVLRCVT